MYVIDDAHHTCIRICSSIVINNISVSSSNSLKFLSFAVFFFAVASVCCDNAEVDLDDLACFVHSFLFMFTFFVYLSVSMKVLSRVIVI